MARILIIDDDPNTQSLLKNRMEKSGYEVIMAADGAEGLRKAEEERPDLILLDIRIPKVDGWQVCRTLKSDPLTSRSCVIMVTGCSQDAQELYGRQCGADAYITKPWDPKELVKCVADTLERSKASRDVRSDVTNQRIRDYVQRIVRVAGALPKDPHLRPMAASLIQISTALFPAYQTALTAHGSVETERTFRLIGQYLSDLRYWLELLRDSKANEIPDIPLLISESTVLLDIVKAVLPRRAA